MDLKHFQLRKKAKYKKKNEDQQEKKIVCERVR